jgi:cellobiose-specific phosphotransferase system component IIA
MFNKINIHFNSFDFDIRKTHNARFIDQKVTPDVLSIIADCILNHVNNNSVAEFTSTDIWRDDYSNENVIDIFGKSDVYNPKARNEYDKFFQQPLKALSYAGVLREIRRGRQIYFTIQNREILKYIAIKERHALEFLNLYLEKVLRDSDIWYLFENFFNSNTKNNFDFLKTQYENFIIQHTPINGKTEVRRIFTKIINPLAFKRKKHGTKGGRFSKDIITQDELMYNRRNWRDIDKKRGETREEYQLRVYNEKSKKEAYVKYTLNKAKNIIKGIHKLTSEVADEFANGEATQVHHIFMKSQYPEISSYLENLILLTATQHFTKAHPNNTSLINRDYQLTCLLAKSESIQKYNTVYSKEDFLYVIKIGLNYEFSKNIDFFELQSKLIELYNDVL